MYEKVFGIISLSFMIFFCLSFFLINTVIVIRHKLLPCEYAEAVHYEISKSLIDKSKNYKLSISLLHLFPSFH